MGTTESELSQDVVFDILSSSRRRYVLYHLRMTGETVKLTDLAEKVAAWENDVEPSEISEQERKRVYVSLYQTHIPRLSDVGLIEYDKDSGRIALADKASDIDKYLGNEAQYSWHPVYLILAGASAVLLWAAVIVDTIPELVASIVIVAAFLVTAMIHVGIQMSRQRSVPDELSKKP